MPRNFKLGLVTVLGVLTGGLAHASTVVVAIAEGEIPGLQPRDKVRAELSVTVDSNGGLQFSQCTTLNAKIRSCEWLENGLAYYLQQIKEISTSIPNDTVRVLTDSSAEAAEARVFLRFSGDKLVQNLEAVISSRPVEPVRVSPAYNAHKMFPYILWRARTF